MHRSFTPLRFVPIFKSMLWGGHRLRPLLGFPDSPEPTGEAWILSDQGDHPSRVVEGPLAGCSLRELVTRFPTEILGRSTLTNGRFPLLLKLLDAQQHLSIQVHPNNEQAQRLDPQGPGLGKTEAWVILQSEPESLLFAGLRPGVDRARFQQAFEANQVPEVIHAYHPLPQDCIFLEAGTVHAIGAGLLLFEIQQTSDITYRLFDWNRVDSKTGKPRELHIAQALECTDYRRGPCNPVIPSLEQEAPIRRERLIDSEFFGLIRYRGDQPFSVGQSGECRILVNIGGACTVHHGSQAYPFRMGEVLLLPAVLQGCECVPQGQTTILECVLPRAS